MSVLIKGMEMPKSCYECKLDLRTDICQAFCEWNAEHPYSIRATDRLPDCPLSEVPEQKKGKWIEIGGIFKWLCPFCSHACVTKNNFCPNCGSYNGGDDNGNE